MGYMCMCACVQFFGTGFHSFPITFYSLSLCLQISFLHGMSGKCRVYLMQFQMKLIHSFLHSLIYLYPAAMLGLTFAKA